MTHNQRVLQLLSDGQPHTHHELYALQVVAHSRISDLRKQGKNIVQWAATENGERVYVYQLVALPEPAVPGDAVAHPGTPGPAAAGSGSATDDGAPAHNPLPGTDPDAEREVFVHPGQLTLGEAA